jgi:spore coat polysaccharide biosynthesis protein SpsF
MTVVGCIQARMNSSRLPGKVMLPLDGNPVVQHVVRRVSSAINIDKTVVATSEEPHDGILELDAAREEYAVYRGSEEDVLGRMRDAASARDADIVVRITADCPLVSPRVIDYIVECLLEDEDLDWTSNILEQTFPTGMDVAAFTFDSFDSVAQRATEPHQREHVVPYYREHPDEFDYRNVPSSEVFEESWLVDRDDLRLTLDKALDYELLLNVYRGIDYDDIISITDAVRYIDEHNLADINEDLSHHSVWERLDIDDPAI